MQITPEQIEQMALESDIEFPLKASEQEIFVESLAAYTARVIELCAAELDSIADSFRGSWHEEKYVKSIDLAAEYIRALKPTGKED